MSQEGGGLIQWLRGPTLLDIVVFDVVITLALSALIGNFVLHLGTALQWVAWISAVFALGVLVHLAAGVDTMLGHYLGLNGRPVRGFADAI
jgi:hypothetical protein